MTIIRFLRTGKKNQAFFRVVVTDKRNPAKAGRFLEILGFYNPLTKEKSLKEDRIKYWISKGAQTSDTVHNLLIREGVIEGKKIPKHRPSKKKEEEKTEEKKEEPASEVKPEEKKEEPASEVKSEEKKEEVKPEEVKEEAKAEEPVKEPSLEAKKEDVAEEETKPEEPKKEEKEIDKKQE
jgi:small subunit ribosomal protein S16